MKRHTGRITLFNRFPAMQPVAGHVESTTRRSAVIALALCTAFGAVNAQNRLSRAVVTSCPDCELSVAKISTIQDGPELSLGSNPAVQMLDDSRAAVWGQGIEGFLEWNVLRGSTRQVGRNGAGPGEYRRVSNVQPLPTGGVRVSDVSLRRMTILDSGLVLRKSFPLQARDQQSRSVWSPNGWLIIGGPYQTPAAAGFALHAHSQAGVYVRSADSLGASYSRGDDARLSRRLLDAGVRGFWSIRPSESTLERWSYNLRREERFPLPSGDLALASAPAWPLGPDAPPPELIAIAAYGPDTLLVLTRISREPWPKVNRQQFSEGGRSSTVYQISPDDADRYFSTRLQLLHVRSRRIITESSVQGLYFSAGDRYLQRTSRGRDGETVLHLLRVELVFKNSQQ